MILELILGLIYVAIGFVALITLVGFLGKLAGKFSRYKE